MKKVLYRSADVRREIARLFSTSKGRRIAITAFVGDGAESFLRNPKGLELICWPKAGGTNPNALRILIKRGVEIFFADSLHMKVYWTEDCGAVITSANLSINALGAGDLREIGVRLNSKDVDIERIISSIKPRPISPSELRELDRRHKVYVAKGRFAGQPRSRRTIFSEWYESLSMRQEWKFYQWEDYHAVSAAAKEVARKEYGVSTVQGSLSVRRGEYKENDWVLCFRRKRGVVKELSWLYANFIVRVPRSDKKAYDPANPYEAVQLWSPRHYEPPPFGLDVRFKSSFSKAVSEYGPSKIEALKSRRLPARLLDLIYSHYTS
jgi:hypothetical protein